MAKQRKVVTKEISFNRQTPNYRIRFQKALKEKRMRTLFTTLVGAAAAVTVSNAFDVQVCSDSLNDLGIKDVSLPETVIAGEQVSVVVTQVPNKYIGKGHFRVELDVEGVKVLSVPFELCDVTDCHLKPHLQSKASFPLTIPKDIPKGFKSSLKIIVNDHNGALLSCVDVHGVKVNKETLDTSNELRVYAGASHDLSLSYSELDFMFRSWQKEHGIRFDSHDEMMDRMAIFASNFEQIALHNKDSSKTFTLGVNEFAHLSQDEFAKTHFGYKGAAKVGTVNRTFYELDVTSLGLTDIPDEIDWTTKGAVTDVKNQGSCGSCWAFSTTGALEGAYFLKTGKLVSFSEQELVSCDHEDMGCNGGLMDNADRFIQKAGGLCTEDDYPYISGTGRHEACKRCSKVEGSSPASVVDVAHSENALEQAVAKQPVSVAIEADQLSFQFYRRGVLTGSCGDRLDHGVLVVGYGTLDGTKYWKVKNSWGPSFGLNGYILIQRGKSVHGGECGVLLSASYPVL